MNKHELDRRVAANLGVHVRQVRAVTTAFTDAITEALLDHGSVQVTNFGTFSVGVQASRHFTVNQGTFKKGERAGKKDVVACPIHVHFRRAPRLKRRLKEQHSGKARCRRIS